jgi:DNA/RNA-binding domain of Phe-tRNA-synthetase-like protein
MKVSIDKSVFQHVHPEFMVGVVRCTLLNNRGKSDDIAEMLRDIEEYIRLHFRKDSIAVHQLISPWKAAVAKFGKKAAHYHTHVEEMMEKVIAGRTVQSKDKLNDVVNFFSLKYIVPAMVVDLKKAGKELTFTASHGDLMLKDNRKVLSRKLDYHSAGAGVSTTTTNALIVVEGLPPLAKQHVVHLLEEVQGLVRFFCQAKTKVAFLDKKNPIVEF